ncbi:DUF4132 domain-containing protein [Glycomyces sp. TRM65418]|uniref:DUF4132 domain-containing protein n=1 Tax=Glycomyces sp. TRM65418 TaxID=2867006 RepID=UPI001CE57DD8|nr:DUF4132 domain-containing protein [Glycomyces sp. TRM65418]MCC3764338.1 DUF4132 domain-containing protein [Glycomyces sp. TRM65418]QZD54017.1 DUF4132 domain-containing protein [Glycomyces sp. TRM65418]
MTESDTPATEAATLPDEDRLAFPDTWKRFVRARRGQGKPRRIKLDAEAGRAFLADHADRARKRLDLAGNREYRNPGLAFLDGDPDLLGAAAVMALASPAVTRTQVVNRPMFDLVTADHGLPFAVAALAEALTFQVDQTGPQNTLRLRRMALNSHFWSKLLQHKEINDVRALLAGASDADYAAVVAAVAQRRTSPAHRVTASLLIPDEHAWMDEACAEHHRHQPSESCTSLLLEVVATGPQLAVLGVKQIGSPWVQAAEIADLLHRFGGEAFPAVAHHLDGYIDGNEKKILFRALAAMPTDQAVQALLDRLDESAAAGFAMEAAANFPRRTLRLIAARLPDAGPDEQKRLSALLYADPILLEAALPETDEQTRAAIATLTAEHRRLPEAPDESLPRLLTSPPWTGAAREAVVIKGLTPPPINRLVWAEGEREAWSEEDTYGMRHYGDRDWEREAQDFDKRSSRSQAIVLALAPKAIAQDLLPRWRIRDQYFELELLQRIVVNLGPDAVEQVAAATPWDASMREVLLPIANLTAARIAADALARLKTMRAFALAWLDRHAADAAALLVPDALGKTKRPRIAAATALRYLASTHGADLVNSAAVQYGEEVAAAVAALVDIDPLQPVGVPMPKPGAWASPAALPQVLLAGRERGLSQEATRHLITVLALGTPEYDYPGVAVVAETCDRSSLARFSLALFEQWLAAGAPSEDGWAVTQLAHFGDDEAVRVLGPLVATWPGESRHQRAVTGLRVLGAIGTETALRAINRIAEKAKFDRIKAEAWDQMEAVAERLGLTAEQLRDRLVPDFGLGEEAALVLDYGPRRFRVGFDEALKPFVTDMDGKPRKTLPKPGAKDDDLLAEAAYRRFAVLRKELREVASEQVRRLERALVSGRTWRFDEFEEHFVRHPLMWHLTRRLVWTASAVGGPVAFRLAEDKGCTDVDENELRLPGSAVVRLAHPALMERGEIESWSAIFADYEILQPFPQLGRPVMAFMDEELRTGRLTRFEGITVHVGRLLGMTNRGWSRSEPLDGGVEPGMTRWLKGAGCIVIDLDPGILVGAIDQCPDQTLRQVVVANEGLGGWRVPEPVRDFGPVDPVDASEALTALANATGVS